MFELVDGVNHGAVIKVIGVGGCGGNAVDHMVERGIEGVDFISINTDAQALKGNSARTTIQVGSSITKGLGAGANPDAGKEAALEDRDRLQDVIEGSDMLFITAGMGGGTGTGAAPVVAQVARELGVLTVAVVTKPFGLEGAKRTRIAEQGILELGKYCDSLITVPNEKLLAVLGAQTSLKDAFAAANQVLQGAVQGIAELITRPGVINVDFADVRTVMHETGQAMMGTGEATGEHRAREAAETAVSSPLLEDVDLAGANGILVNITASDSLALGEFQEVGDAVKDIAADEATVVVGTAFDPDLDDKIRVTVVATGIGRSQAPELVKQPKLTTVHRRVSGEIDYGRYDQPTAHRGRDRGRDEEDVSADASPGVASPRRGATGGAGGELPDTLNVPAFLRRQAD